MHKWGIGPAGREHVRHRGQLFEIELHEPGDVLCLRPCGGHTGSDHLADVAHLAAGEDLLTRVLEALDGRGRPDGLHARQLLDREHGVNMRIRHLTSRMRACATGLRTKAISRVPAKRKSATYWPRPIRKRASSLRVTEAPTPKPAISHHPCVISLPKTWACQTHWLQSSIVVLLLGRPDVCRDGQGLSLRSMGTRHLLANVTT